MKRIVIAFGGNALLQKGDKPDFATQIQRARGALTGIADIISRHETVITHGNGPQVGNILLQNEIANTSVPRMPLHACGAMSQGLIGEAILLAYESVRSELGISKEMTSVVSRTLVTADDEAFNNPTKPVGSFYNEVEANGLMKFQGWPMKEYPGKGWRRLVPSPQPVEILEKRAILNLLANNFIPLSVGGGGIPVIRESAGYLGVDAVIDKDLASAVLARDIGADRLLILTDVESVFRDYGKKSQKAIENITYSDLDTLYESGEFENGSMAPKIRAVLNFIRDGGEEAHIAPLSNGLDALNGNSGTTVTRN